VPSLDTFVDIYTQAGLLLVQDITDTDILNTLQQGVNMSYDQLAKSYRFWWLQKEASVDLKPKYETGNILTTTQDGTTIVGTGTSWSGNVAAGDKILIAGDQETYPIQSVDSDTGITLGTASDAVAYKGSTISSATAYKIFRDVYALPSDFLDMLRPHIAFGRLMIKPVGLNRMRFLQELNFSGEGPPQHYTIVSDETSNPPAQELMVEPFPDQRYTPYFDYVRQVTPLSATSDVPLTPREFRDIHVYEAAADFAQFRANDPERGDRFRAIAEARKLVMMQHQKSKETEDRPVIRPDLSAYRRVSVGAKRFDPNFSRNFG